MKTILITLLTIILLNDVVVANDESSVAYFANMPFRETPYADLRGIFPISKTQAQTRKHYRFKYDVQGRVTEVAFMQGDDYMPLNISRNALTHASITKITYLDNGESRLFFDHLGEPTTSNGVYREEYRYNKLGYRTSLKFYNEADEQIESRWEIYLYEWHTDKFGTVTEQRFNKVGEPASLRRGFKFYRLKLHYDARGWLSMMENYGKDCKELTLSSQNGAQDKLEYDINGAILSWNVFNEKQQPVSGNGPNVTRGIMIPDEFGHTIRQYYLDAEGNQITNAYGWTDSTSLYDSHGNMKSRFNYNAEGKRIINPQVGYSGYRFTYDKEGKYRTSMAYYDENDKPAYHSVRGYHRLVTRRDAKGQLESHKFLDSQGNLVSRKDNCVATIMYQYGEKNEIKETIRLDANRKPVTSCQAD